MLPPHLLTECLGKHFGGIRAYPEDAVPNILHSGVILKMLLLTFLHPSISRGCYCKHSQGITQQMETRQQRPSSSRKCYYRHSSGITWADNGNINRNFEHLTCIQSSQSLPYMRGRGEGRVTRSLECPSHAETSEYGCAFRIRFILTMGYDH